MNKNPFLEGLAQFFLQVFPARFDQLDKKFYHLPLEEQKKRLDIFFPEQTTFFSELKRTMLFSSLQEITEAIVSFLGALRESPVIIVQSPVFLEPEFKAEIRKEFLTSYPYSFVTFHVNASLMGGLRVFMNGHVEDFSWFSRVQKIRQLQSFLITSNSSSLSLRAEGQ